MPTRYYDPYATETATGRRPISWGAILVALFLVIAIQALLGILGLGIGLTSVRPATSGAPDPGNAGIVASIWWTLSNIVALVVGGYAASRLSGVWDRLDGTLHGLGTWAVALVLTLVLLSTAVGKVVGGTVNVLGGVLSTAASAVGTGAQKGAEVAGVGPEQIQDAARQMMAPADPAQLNDEQARNELVRYLGDVAAGRQPDEASRDRVVTVLSTKLNISRDDAAKRLDDWKAKTDKAKADAAQTARQAGEASARTVSQGALWAVLALVLGAVAAAVGGYVGARGDPI
jgi:hypothetical protein